MPPVWGQPSLTPSGPAAGGTAGIVHTATPEPLSAVLLFERARVRDGFEKPSVPGASGSGVGDIVHSGWSKSGWSKSRS